MRQPAKKTAKSSPARLAGGPLLLALAWLGTGCGSDSAQSSGSGRRLAKALEDEGEDSFGDKAAKKKQNKAKAATRKQSSSSTSSDDDALPGGEGEAPEENLDDVALSLFEKTVFPIMRANCASCHAKDIAPTIAAPDAKAAMESIVVTKKVDFANPEKSRLVLRLMPDKHNCWTTCENDVVAMQDAVTTWAGVYQDQIAQDPKLPTTVAAKFADAKNVTLNHTNPPNTFVFEAEAGLLKAPFAITPASERSGGNYIGTPAGAGNAANANNARNNAALGTMLYNINVTTAGNFRVFGQINAATDANASFYLRFDNANALAPWLFMATGEDFVWDTADAVAEAGTPTNFALTVGAHQLELRQRQEQAGIDMIAISSDPGFDPAVAKPDGTYDVKMLEFDLSEMSGVPGAKLKIEVSDYSANGYIFKNPQIETTAPLKVKELKLLINGEFLPQQATYTVVDQVVTPPGAILSKAALVAIKDKGLELDEFTFQFGVIGAAP